MIQFLTVPRCSQWTLWQVGGIPLWQQVGEERSGSAAGKVGQLCPHPKQLPLPQTWTGGRAGLWSSLRDFLCWPPSRRSSHPSSPSFLFPTFPFFLPLILLSCQNPSPLPALLAVYPALWSAPLSGGCPPAKGGAGTEHIEEQPGWQVTPLAWGSSSPPDGDRGLCSLSSSSMLVTRIALKFTDLTTDH